MLTLALGLALPGTALACGGFFCSSAAPVDQAGEEVIFVDHADGEITLLVRIQYDGPSQRFAWVLPVQGVPEVRISSNVVFDRLRSATDPRYVLEQRIEGECKPPEPPDDDGCDICDNLFGGLSVQTTSYERGGEPSVSALITSEVGPYDYTVIHVEAADADPAAVAIEWLRDNGYDLTGVAPDLLRPYLADGLNLLAFKLSKDAGTYSGSVRPVSISYRAEQPVIPLRLTAVAAQDDMGILVWVLGRARAVPLNYKSLVLNEALIDWLQRGFNYRTVVSAATDEAGGQGFVTEMAGDPKPLADAVFSSADAEAWLGYLARRPYVDGFAAIMAAQPLYGGWDGWVEAIRAAVTLPANVSFSDFGQSPERYRGVAAIDQARFAEGLGKNVIEPVLYALPLLSESSRFTRFFGTMSADEMTLDPAFDFNPDLPDVSNVHTALRILECTPDRYEREASFRIELPSGGVVHEAPVVDGGIRASFWPHCVGPANLQVMQVGTRGRGLVVQDNGAAIAEQLASRTETAAAPCKPGELRAAALDAGAAAAPRLDAGAGEDERKRDAGPSRPRRTSAPSAADSDDCSVVHVGTRHGSPAAPSWGLSLLALALACRRSRARRK